jgi:hypothetical protein
MTTIKRLAGRSGLVFAALAFGVAVLVPALVPSGTVYAAGQFSPRKVTLSSNAIGSVSTDGNGATYAPGAGGNGAKAIHTFNFTQATSGATIGSVALQYCTTPFFGSTCTEPSAAFPMDASTVTTIASSANFNAAAAPALDTTTTANSGFFSGGNACVGTGALRRNCILVSRATAQVEAGTPAFSLAFGTGGATNYIKNPGVTGTYYVRITTFSDTTYTTVVDQGAVAFATTDTIDITAKVQEKLNFSVSNATNAPTGSCVALPAGGALSLGDVNGVLDTLTAYDTHSYFRVSTNSANGTAVFYSGDTLKTVGGTSTIAAVPTTATLSAPGTEQFGLGFDNGDATANGWSVTHLTTRTAAYNAANGNINPTVAAQFAFNAASVTTPIQLASASAHVACDTLSVRYIGNIATTTKAGVYKTSIAYIAVPTY